MEFAVAMNATALPLKQAVHIEFQNCIPYRSDLVSALPDLRSPGHTYFQSADIAKKRRKNTYIWE